MTACAFALISLLAVATMTPLFGHHLITEVYDVRQATTITGTIDGLVLTNPHAFIHLSVVGDEVRTRTWAVELEGATQLRQKGIDGTTFAIGDTVTVCGNPGRDVNQYRLLMLELRRLSDGFPSGRRIRRGVSSVAAPRHRLYSRDNRRFPTAKGSGCDAHTVPPL